MIRAEGLIARYGDRVVLDGLDFRIAKGELVGLLGPNGSGKTTLLNCLSKVVPLHGGRVAVSGRDLSEYSSAELARVEASVPQQLDISFPFTCIEVVLMGRYPHQQGFGTDSEEDLDTAMESMRLTDSLDLAKRPITEISGGEAQRVIIARALAQRAQVMLLDEATANLDVAHKTEMFDLFLEKNRQGTTFVCAMHDLNLAALYCQRLVFLKHGRIAVDGSTVDTFTEETLSSIYETEVRIIQHPDTGAPQAMFVPGQRASSGQM
ncbi:MAG: ABC transporter ATP-binding protein [Deltaproteobacteria bacterium]|nr:MAG: ABC transporter ATP-binding protein [Deltaproteobacteria bacterium]